MKAHNIDKLTEGVDNFAQVTGNKSTWASHDKSSGHKEALHAYGVRPNVLHKLQATGVLEAVRGRRALLSLLDMGLRQNIPIRGHSHTEGNFQLLLGYLCSHEDNMKWWTSRSHKTKFTSVEILNEMCELIGISTMRLISEHLRNKKFAFMINRRRLES